MKFILNGRHCEVNEGKFEVPFITYYWLAQKAGVDPELNPTLTYSFPDGRCGVVTKDRPLVPAAEGAIYNIMVTGNA